MAGPAYWTGPLADRLAAATVRVAGMDDRAYARLTAWTYREAVVGPAGYLMDLQAYLREGDLTDTDLDRLETAMDQAEGVG